MAETPRQGDSERREIPPAFRKQDVLDCSIREQCSLEDELSEDLCRDKGMSVAPAPERQYPPEYFNKFTKVGIPPEMDDSQRDIKMMKYYQALDYYEKMVGHEKKSYGWFVDLEIFGAKVKVNVVMACLLKELEARCKAMGMKDLKFKTLSGLVVKGGFHNYGMAVDFDSKDHWLQKPKDTKWTMPMAMALEMQKMGFKWGMYFHESREDGMTDSMHFEYRGTIEDAIAQLKSPEAIQFAQEYVLPKWRFRGQTLYKYATRDSEGNSKT